MNPKHSHCSRSLAMALFGVPSALAAQFNFAAPVSTPNPFGTSANPEYVTALNLDGDAFCDLATSPAGGSTTTTGVAVLRNDPAAPGSFLPTLIPGVARGKIYGADLDANGYDDLIVASGSEIQYVLNDGTGGFPGSIVRYIAAGGGRIMDLRFGSFDTDAGLEIAVLKTVGVPITAIHLEIVDIDSTSMTLTSAADFQVPGGSNQASYGGLAPLDIDGDGDLDFLLYGGRVVRNYSSASGLSFVQDLSLGQIAYPGCVASGDLNGDACADVFFTQTYGQTAVPGLTAITAESRCGPGFAMGPRFTGLSNGIGYSCSAVDFNGDGSDEILFNIFDSSVRNIVAKVAHTQASGALSPNVTTIGIAKASPATADFDDDGDQDLACIAGSAIHFYANETVTHSIESITESPWPPASGVPTMTWVDSQSRSTAPDGSVNHPYRTITEAVNNTTTGATILVRPGSYNCLNGEASTIQLTGKELVAVQGPQSTVLREIEFECRGGARITGFTLRASMGSSIRGLIRTWDATIVGNRLFGGSPLNGIEVQPGSHTTYIGSNIIVGFRAAVEVLNGDTTTGYPSAIIRNNTMVDDTLGVLFAGAATIEIVNNIILGPGLSGIFRTCAPLTQLTVDYNWLPLNEFIDRYTTSIAMGQTACNQPFTLAAGPHDRSDPFPSTEFLDPANSDYRLQPNSMAIDAGDRSLTASTWLGIDVDGDSRSAYSFLNPAYYGLVPDLGADEVTGNPLQVTQSPSRWVFETRGPSNSLFALNLSAAPGLFPVLEGNSFLLINLFGYLGSLPTMTGPNASLAMTRIPFPAGTRIYVQGVVLDPTTLRYTLTNAAVFTAD
ncbi:MAG: FG-GAP-like repeat-containing protein [Planctomycetota bacterium]